MQGWIKLHRKLLENPIFLKEGLLQLFIYCLLKANHEPKKIIFNGTEMVVDIGQFITGRDVLSRELKQPQSTIRNRLQVLKELNILDIKSNNRFSLVTIVNYSIYQDESEKEDSKKDNKRTTRGQQEDTNKNDKNDKNEKKIKDIYITAQNLTMTKDEYDKLITQYGQIKVDNKIEYARNYKNLKKYVSLYLTLNNWLKADGLKESDSDGGSKENNGTIHFKGINKSNFLANTGTEV